MDPDKMTVTRRREMNRGPNLHMGGNRDNVLFNIIRRFYPFYRSLPEK